ncbi:MAG: DEAD/DEAH box helicase [Chloroflexi bacterium RBG_16_56_11]|nr:MAG: DEAD/DEAH box helicase [Chloroflexi bacterium RBG_16_56_11]
MEIQAFLNQVRSQSDYQDQIAHIEHLPPRRPAYGELDEPLDQRLQSCLEARGLWPLYAHQARAVNFSRRGKNVIVATFSASGKTLCYNIAVMQTMLAEPGCRALYLFPTKALAQDQLGKLHELFTPDLLPFDAMSTFDGDTPKSERADIRRQARIILTNPDMLHIGIMPNHLTWAGFLRHLRYVVVDEAHIYRGVFGSHVACVLRRLRRLCRAYGSEPRFILATATVANPGEHAGRLTGLPCEVVDNDGSPRGWKDFVFWNPPLIDEKKTARRSAHWESTNLFTALVSQGTRTLTFTRTRRLTELIYVYAKDRLGEISYPLSKLVMPYRAGYLPEDRRRIERELFGGKLLGVVATNALELGIDSGGLEATVLDGYPGSISSTWQQAGRSGRSQGESLSFLVAWDNPLDQYFMRHPSDFFQKGFENVLVNPGNPYILKAHLLCAAWERPLDGNDEAIFGPDFVPQRDALVQEGRLRERRGRWYLAPSIAYPAQAINIRSSSGETYAVVDVSTGSLMETVESSVAFFQVHPGAIYLHQGESYLITRLDLTNKVAYAEPTRAQYYTETKEIHDLRILNVRESKTIGPVNVHLGDVEVTVAVVGFKKIRQFSEETIGEEPLDLPTITFPTVALWFDVPPAAVSRIARSGLDFAGGLHATEHAAIGILPLFALCDRNDIGGVSTPFHPDTGHAQVFIYDAYPGGIGIAEKGYEMITDLWAATLRVIAECPCDDGCPSCVQSPKCGNNNKPLDKAAAKVILREIQSG